MNEGEAMVAALSILCGTGVLMTIVLSIRSAVVGRASNVQKELVEQLKALREETRQLRQQNNDLVLALDGGLREVEGRLARVEARQQAIPAQAEQHVGRG